MRNLAIVVNRVVAKFREPSIKQTISFIKKAHAEQKDWGGKPYWLHPVDVMNLLPADAPKFAKLAALLHDVVEDTDYTLDDLAKRGYSAATLDIVDLVTRRKEDKRSYLEKIQGIVNSGNVWAMQVKKADNTNNLDPKRHENLSPSQLKTVEGLGRRYRASLDILNKGIARRELRRA